MPPRLLASAVLPILLLVGFSCAEDDRRAIVRRGKSATALVVLPSGRGFGSAFGTGAGFFVTNEHAVRGLLKGQALSLVLHSGEDDEKVVSARVVRVDARLDLALLKVDGVKGLSGLELGDEGGLSETDQVTAFGYPFGSLLAVKERKYPSISVNVGRISALRKQKQGLVSIQLDAVLNPGNSGGPVLDGKGKVIGVVRAGIRGSGVNFAIPVSHLREFFDRPEIVFAPAAIPHARRSQPTQFTIRLVSFGKASVKSSVEVALVAGGRERKFTARPGKDAVYRFTAAPISLGKGPLRVPLKLIFPAGRIQCTVEDQAFKIDGKTLRLGEVRTISQGKRPTVVTRDGAEVAGAVSGLGPVQAELGGYAVGLDLSRVPRIEVEHVKETIDRVDYTVTVRQGDRVVNRLEGSIRIEGGPVSRAPGMTPRVTPPVLAAEKTVVRLPAGIEQLAVGGGGRYLVLYLQRLGKLAVFDVSQARVVRYLPAPADDFLFAAGAEKLVVVIPGKKLLERWSLRTFEKERSLPLPVDFAPARAALGSQSAGPLLLWGPPKNTALIDLDTLKKLAAPIEIAGNLKPHGLEIEAARDGSAFTTWFRRQHTEEPSRFGLFRLHGDKVNYRFGLSMQAPCHASIDGGPVFTGDGNVCNADLKPVPSPDLKGASLLPVQNSYVLVARWEGKERKCRLAVHLMSNLKELFSIGAVPELDGLVTDRTDPNAFSYDKRIQFVPSANVLLTISATNDRITVRKLDVDAALKKSPVDYLFVTSVPVRQAVKGTTYTYQVEVKSKKGKVEYRLDSGPKGMSLSKTGRLTWDVPADFAEAEAAVIVEITDASGQQVFHSFTIRCR